jgi:hypothetical protein
MTFETLGSKRNERLQGVVAAIVNELMYQECKWGAGKAQSLAGYLLIMQREINEAIDGWMKNADGRDAPLAEVVQVAAVAIRCLEEYGTKGSARPTRDVTEAEMKLEREAAMARRFGA